MLLYKYEKAKWGMTILKELRLKVSPPNEFNDPFEFTPVTVNPLASLTPENLDRLDDCLHKQRLKTSKGEDLQKVLSALMQTNPSVRDFAMGFISADMDSLDEASKRFGMLCLSEAVTNIRMWAHYGDKHRGVSIGLDLDNEVSDMEGVVHTSAK